MSFRERLVGGLVVGLLAIGALPSLAEPAGESPAKAPASHGAKPAKRSASPFWKLRSERAETPRVQLFAAAEPSGAGQGVLMWAHWPATPEASPELQPTEVVRGLYRDLKDFHLLGSKPASWGREPAHLLAFKATVQGRPVLGRCLLAQPASGREVLLLTTNPDQATRFLKEWERLQAHWVFGGEGASNVLYSP